MNKTFLNLRGEMIKHGETYDDIANLLGLKRPAIAKRFNGQSDWRFQETELLSQHYKMSIDKLFARN